MNWNRESIGVVDYESPDAASLFASALHRSGFCIIENHPLSQVRLDPIYEEWAAWFNSDLKYAEFEAGHGRSEPMAAGLPELEFYHITTERLCPRSLSDATLAYFDEALSLVTTLLVWLDQLLPEELASKLPCSLSRMPEESTRTRLRVLHYHAIHQPLAPDAMRAASHVDHNLLTLIPASTGPGLEVRDDLGRWNPVNGREGAMLVLAGSMMELVSSAYFKAGYHRVVVPYEKKEQGERTALLVLVQPANEVLLTHDCTAEQFVERRIGPCIGFNDHRIL